MPSLRRTLSSPSVRSSPYHSAVSGRGHGPRRTSGSAISTRRVLADIDWWRVTDGQLLDADADVNEEAEEMRRAQDQPALAEVDDGADVREAGVERPSTPLFTGSTRVEESPQAMFSLFPALAITPRTPIRRTVSESSTFSLESSPDSEGPFTPSEASFVLADLGFADAGMDILPGRMRPLPLSAVKSYSFSAFTTPEKDDEDECARLAEAVSIHDNDLFA
ncbi:hypothetical protein DENSPDRAFT_850084 [Dentipellis sp. KUC8613]|nr:hypothetical protein DENSPDRAFT_850084 [Dentipellis sp. KUC8613]